MADDNNYVVEMIFQDPTPNGHINQRISNAFGLNLDKVDLNQDEQEQLMHLLLLVAKKLAITWRHLDRYRQIEDDLIARAKATQLVVDGKHTGFDYSDELYAEFDGFLVQLKSSLDHLVKVPVPIFGPKSWKPHTFGDKGNDVIKMLENNTPKKFEKHIRVICDRVIRRNQDWLQLTIDLRDKVNHYLEGGVPYQFFRVRKVRRGNREVIVVPMWSKVQTLRQALEIVWCRLMCLCEEFIGFTVFLRLKPYWEVKYRHIEDESDTNRWGFTLNREALNESLGKQ